MPELPEVETSRRGIEPHLVGATILHAATDACAGRFQKRSTVKRPTSAYAQRRAKYLLLELPEGWIIIHLGMSGSLRILPEELPEKHDHVDLVMNNGKVLRYTDPRRFGAGCGPKSWKGIMCWPILDRSRLATISMVSICIRSARRKTAIKPWLMDNKLVVGVGNIYASESLFAAGIHPIGWRHHCRWRSANCWLG
ncbi:hypothetical protein ECZU38_52300 [Escherichia coli]|nr:hypothetical protein ECZU38_52300 [Escherichia coli]